MISDLRLMNFRCFEGLRLQLPEQGALFVGNNAQGKTSILEAICVLVRLQSPRVKRMKPLVQFEQPGYGIAGECWGRDLQVRYGKGGLVMKIDGDEVGKQAVYFQHGGLVVWMGNEDLELVRGASEVRRRYLDFLGSQVDPQYRVSMLRYRRALKVRNLLLKDSEPREQEIQAYDVILIENGDYLMEARQKLVEQLEPKVAEAQVAVGNGNEVLTMEYKPSGSMDMKSALERTYEKERRIRQTVVGPHRDDVKLLLNGLPANDYASEGQQRTLALALKLGQGDSLRYIGGKTPIYLLDDIFGELDPERRNALIGYLPEAAQKFITTTNLDWMDERWAGWRRYSVVEGAVEQWT